MRKKNKAYQIYGDLIFKHRPTIKTMIIDILYEKFIASKREKQSVYRQNSQFPPFQQETPKQGFKFIAIINKDNNSVVEIIKVNEKAAEHILNESNILLAFNPEEQKVKRGSVYQNGNFVDGEVNEEN